MRHTSAPPSRRARLLWPIAVLALLVAACAPGDDESATTTTEAEAATETTATEDTSGETTEEGDASGDEGDEMSGPSCGTDDVVLRAVFETGFDLPFELADEFTNQYPNVTWDISQDQFNNLITTTPRLLDGDNPPDLIRLPTMVSLVQDGLLLNLDGYAEDFGWTEWSEAQFSQNRVDENGVRGSGSLYAFGINHSLTGVFYNIEQAAQIGMTEPPATVEEFDALLAEAAAQGLQPIQVWNAAASGGGLAFPLQQLMAAYGDPAAINAWIFQEPGASIDNADNVAAAEHLKGWIDAGYFPEDANAIEYTDANARFRAGDGVFIFNGDWENATYDGEMFGNVGFFVFPGLEAGAPLAAMSSPNTYGIATNAANPDCAAFFLNWVATDPVARQLNVDLNGSNPGGPSDMALPDVTEGSVTEQTLAGGNQIDLGMDFIANATGAIFAEGWTPELQKMVGDRQDAAGLITTVQAEYEDQLEG